MDTEDLNQLASAMKALGHPIRLRIYVDFLEHVQETGSDACDLTDEPCWRDYARDLGIAPSTLSHHIKELSQANLITLERVGQRRVAHLSPRGFKALQTLIDRLPEKST